MAEQMMQTNHYGTNLSRNLYHGKVHFKNDDCELIGCVPVPAEPVEAPESLLLTDEEIKQIINKSSGNLPVIVIENIGFVANGEKILKSIKEVAKAQSVKTARYIVADLEDWFAFNMPMVSERLKESKSFAALKQKWEG